MLTETGWSAVKYLVGADQVVYTVAKILRQMWGE
jgi:hypothetical protein